MKFPYVGYSVTLTSCAVADTFTQNIGLWENIQSTLGRNPLLWCCPSVPAGTGLKYRVAEGHGKWIELTRRDREGDCFGEYDRRTNGYDDDYDASHQA